MSDFIMEILPEIVGIVVMALSFLLLSTRSVKDNVAGIEKKRLAEGLAPMLEKEKQIIATQWRSSVLGDFVGALAAGIVALVVVSLMA